jgi:hypothetical protein
MSWFGNSAPQPSVQPQIQDMIAKRRQAEINASQYYTYTSGDPNPNASWEAAVQTELTKLSNEKVGGKSKRKNKQRKTKCRR